MSNQIVISSGAKVRSLEGVLTGTAGIVNSVPLGGANGVATLDALGKVPLSQLPASVVTYLGTWNAATNTPTLTNGVGDTGDLYICNVAGTVNFGAGPITFAVGDWVIYSGTEWQKSAGASGTVTSVALTESGDALTITGSPITTSGTINIGFAGTGSQYIKGDGTLATFPTTIDQAKRLITEVYNSTGATLTKGTVVYINGGQGNLPTVTKAQANNDANSAQTYGVVQNDITNNNNGFVVVFGSITDIDTQAYAVGTQLYLSGTTAGEWTSTKPSAPIHLVYVGIVVRSHPTQGVVEIRIQNGYELEELHDVAISAPVNNQGIFYNSSNDLWENKSIATALGYTPANDALVVHLAGTETITGAKTFTGGASFTLAGGVVGFSGGIAVDKGNAITKGSTPASFSPASTTLYSALGDNNLVLRDSTNTSILQFQAASSYTYTFPSINGTVTLLEGTQTFTGSKTFGGAVSFNFAGSSPIVNYGLALVKGNIPPVTSGAWSNIYASSGNNNLTIIDTNNTSVLQFQGSSSYTYTFPAATGTIALTSDLSSYVTLGTTQTISGQKTFSGGVLIDTGSILIKNGINATTAGYTGFGVSTSGTTDSFRLYFGSGQNSGFNFTNTGTYTYTFPASTGTLVLGTGTTNYLPKFTGASTIGNSLIQDDGTSVGIGGSPNASYKLAVTGASLFTDNLSVTSAYGFTIGAVSGAARIQHGSSAANSFTFLTSGNGFANLYAGAAIFSSFVGINGSPATAFPLEAYINSSTAYSSTSRGNVMRVYNSNTGANVFAGIELGGAGTANDGLAGINAVVTGSGSAALTFYTRDGGTFAERFRVSPSGNVGIANTNPIYKLDVHNGSDFDIRLRDTSLGGTVGILFETANDFSGTSQAYIKGIGAGNSGVSQLIFGTAGGSGDTTATERMRITSGGYTKMSNTGSYEYVNASIHEVRNSAADYILYGTNPHASNPSGYYISYPSASPNNTSNYFIACADSSAARFRVASNGNCYNVTGTYTSGVSDIRYKEQIVDANSQWNDIKSLRVVNFKFIKDVEENGENALRQIGFIAQEVEEVSPNLVDEMYDEKTGESWKTIKASIIHLKAVKALQEAMARIEELEAKITALENK